MPEYLQTAFDWNDPNQVSVYDELSLWSARFGALLLEHVPFQPGMQVMDLACGTGFPLLELAQVLGPGSRVVGLDPWRAALARARLKMEIMHIPNTWVVEGNGERMPFPVDHFDLIVSNLGINNFEAPERVFAECHRVLRPGGRVALTTNLKGHMDEFYQVFERTLVETGCQDRLDVLEEHINHRVTVSRACQMLIQAGFRISTVIEDAYRWRFLNGSAFLAHTFIRLGFLDGWRGVAGPEREVEVFSRLEQDLNRLAGDQGELALTIPIAYIEAQKI